MRRFWLALGALIVLSACDRAPTPIEPAAKASASAPSPTDATSTLKPPEAPPNLNEVSLRGRAAFAGYWIHLLNYSVVTGTTRHLKAVSSPTCGGCNNYMDQIRKDRREGIRSDSFEWTPVTAGPGSSSDVVVAVTAAAYERRSGKAEPIRVPSARYEVGFELERQGSRWRVRELYIPK